MDEHGHLFVANQTAGGRHSESPFTPGSVAIYDTATHRELGRYTFTDSFFSTSNFPLAIAATRDGRRVYVASERDNALFVLNTANPAAPTLRAKIPTGDHPEALALSADERRIYVANADSDTLTVIDAAGNRVLDTILLRPAAAKNLPGCSPTGLCFSNDAKFAYVTLGDLNAVAVVDLADAEVDGYMPTAWYPTSAVPDPRRPAPPRHQRQRQRPAHPQHPQLPRLDPPRRIPPEPARRRRRAPRHPRPRRSRRPLRASPQEQPPRHTRPRRQPPRTLLPEGRRHHPRPLHHQGEPHLRPNPRRPAARQRRQIPLPLRPRNVTPNQHALAERFVLLDNLYACGEVSGDGWCWSTQSIANPYVARNVPYNYSQRGRKFDFEGQNNGYPTGGFPAKDPDGKPLATLPYFKNGAAPIPDVAQAGGGYLWDLCTKNHISFRNYGFFGYFADEGAGYVGGPENYPSTKGLQPAGHDLAGLTDIDFRRFDMDYADSDGPANLFAKTGNKDFLYDTPTYGQYNAPSRFSEWKREFQEFFKKDPTGNAVPNLMFLRIPCDHTVGGKSGKHTPTGYVADNDYAVGQIVEAVSHSPIWPHCAIFIIEDDAQSGADHVDCHRTTGFVISPHIAAHAVDHHFYNTDSFLRSMELLLNLPPLTHYDATAAPIMNWTIEPGNAAPWQAIMPPAELFAERNALASEAANSARRFYADLAAQSDKMDFVHPDAAPADQLNAIVWQLVRGPGSHPPHPRHPADDD